MRVPDRIDAIHSLVGGQISGIEGGETFYHDGQTPPTEAEISTKLSELETEYDSQAYARNRKAEYDALDQFEMQYDDKKNSTTTWDDAIDAIKAKWPKDNSGPV
jgi:hypothetical protein